MQPGRIQLDARAGEGRTAALLGQHDLVRHRRQVDLVGLLVQVVGRGQILLAEEVADVGRLAVRMTLLRGLGGLRRNRERLRGAGVGQVVVRVVVAVRLGARDRFEPEVTVEELVEQLLVAPVLDQRHPQHAPQGLAIGQGAVSGRGVHGVERLGHRHADPAQPQEPHEPVQARFPLRSSSRSRPTAPGAGPGPWRRSGVPCPAGTGGPRSRPRRPPWAPRSSARRGGRAGLSPLVRPSPRRRDRQGQPVRDRDRGCGRAHDRGHGRGRAGGRVRVVGFGVQGGVRVDQGRQRVQRAPDVARVLHHHRDGVGEDGRGDFLDAEHRQRPGPVHGLRDAGRLAQVEPAQPADDLDEVLGGRVGQAGLLAPQDLELALGARIVEKQVQAAALERGGQVAGVVRGEDDARRVAGHERADLRHRYLILGEHLEQDRLQGLVRAVDLVDQQHHGIGRADGFEQRARGEEAFGEEGALLLRDPLDRGMQVGVSPSNWPIFSRRIWVYRSCLP